MLSIANPHINKVTVNIAYFVLALVLLVACSKIYIPLEPVPITMQTVGVMLVGFLHGMRIGITAIFSYIILGFIGVPVFATAAAGPAVLLGPTGGYIFGFALCIYIMNKLRDKFGLQTIIAIFSIGVIGNIGIFVVGISWLAIYLGSLNQAILTGFVPFIIPGLAKVGILAVILRILGILKLKFIK